MNPSLAVKSAPDKVNDRDFYERFWSSHTTGLAAQIAIHTESRRPYYSLIARFLAGMNSPSFLEVGCGTALDTCILARRFPQARAVATDLSENAVEIAARNVSDLGLQVETRVADLYALPFAGSTFDLVFSQGVLEHFRDPAPAILEQLRVLRPSGVLVVDVPQKYNLYTVRKRKAMRAGTWAWGWETEYSFADLRSWAPRFGLDVCGAVGHQHGRVVDRLLIHPHRMIRNKLAQRRGLPVATGYVPGRVALAWENLWDRIDSLAGPYLAINIAVAFRKSSA